MYMVGDGEIYVYIDRWGYLSFCLAACSPLDVGGVCLVNAMSQCMWTAGCVDFCSQVR